MAMKYLGDHLDIHSGGVDLAFPHHENEIAQSECSCGKPFFKHWIHTAHLLVESRKMSKSLDNFYTVDDIEAKGYAPVVLRYALTSGHYRQTINFTMDSLAAAQSALVRLRKYSDEICAAAGLKRPALLKAIDKVQHRDLEWGDFAKAWDSLAHDLNIPGALGGIFTVLKTSKPSELSAEAARGQAIAFHKLTFALGYDLETVVAEKPKEDAPPAIANLAAERWEAKQARDWSRADELRDQVLQQGWLIKDRKDGYDLEPK